MIMQKLKHETAHYHKQLEANPYSIALMNNTITRENYRTLLRKFYTFYEPMEIQLGLMPHWKDIGLNFDNRRKVHLLVADLLALGDTNFSLAGMPLCAELPPVRTLAQALGCLYVFEGATLGGQLILRHMQAHFGFTAQNGCAFYSSYGDSIGVMWKQFGRIVTEQATTPKIEAEIVESACQTFTRVEAWIKTVQPWEAQPIL